MKRTDIRDYDLQVARDDEFHNFSVVLKSRVRYHGSANTHLSLALRFNRDSLDESDKAIFKLIDDWILKKLELGLNIDQGNP